MQEIFESALDLNPNFTDEDLKNIVYESFEQIFTYLGEAKFIRWINKKELSENMKKLVIELFTEQEEKNYPNWSGFYTMSTNRIKLKSKDVNTNIHETYHFITDYRGRFNEFMNEGLTEYMNVKTQNKNSCSYYQNVKFIAFLHKMMGDSLIRAYFIGVDEQFKKNMSTYISEDGKESLEEYSKFDNLLNELHQVLYSDKKDDIFENEIETQENYKDSLISDFKEYVKNIACNSFAKQVKNLNFYKNGELDFRAVVDEIRKIVKSAQSACIDYNFLDIEFDNEIYKRCLEIFLDGTHILTDGNREGQKSEIVKKVFSPAERIGPNSKKPANIYFHNLEEVYKDSYNALPFKLAKIKLEDNQELLKDGKFDIAKFLTQIALIKTATNVSELELDTIISNYLLKNISKEVDIKSVNEAIKNTLSVQESLNKIQVEREKNTVESRFVKITDENYIEKRDNQFWYIQIDKKTGKIKQSRFPNIIDCRPVGRNAFKENDLRDFDSRIIAGSIQTRNGTIQIAIDDNFEKIVVQQNGKVKKDCLKLENIDDLKNYVYSQELIKDLKDKIKNNEYTTILKDAENPYRIEGVAYTADIDIRTKKIDIVSFIEYSKKVLRAIPTNLQNNIFDELIEDLIQRTYSLDLSKNKEQIDVLKQQIKLNMISEKESDKEKSLNNINEVLEQFDEIRKSKNLNNKKNVCVIFLNPTAKIRYTSNERYKKYKENLEAKKEFIHNTSNYITSKEDLYVSETSCVTQNMLGVFQTVSCPAITAVEVDMVNYIKDLKNFTKEIPNGDKKMFLEEIVEKSLQRWFGIPSRNEKLYSERMDLYKELSEKIKEFMFSEKEIENSDLEFFKNRCEQINDISKIEAETSIKTSLLFFEDSETSQTFSNICKIQRDSNIPEESKKVVIDSLVKSNNQRLTMKRLLENSLKNSTPATRSSVDAVERIYFRTQEQEVQKS